MTEALKQRTIDHLSEIENEGLTRRLACPVGIDLSSNDYLRLATDERLKQAAINAIEKGGIGATASRLLRGHREIFADAEQKLATWKQTERSLFFGSGYLANLGLFTTFIERNDLVISDEFNHASIIDGIRLAKAKRAKMKHRCVDSLVKLIRNNDRGTQKFLVTESLFSMDGDIAPLDKYAEICRETNTNLIVDEAHAVGMFGQTGSGLIEDFGLEKEVFLSVNTAGKALGVSGAFIAGSEWAIEYLIQKARQFIFTTAPPPAIPAALSTSIDIVIQEPERREKLHYLANRFREMLRERDFGVGADFGSDRSPIVPVVIGDNRRALQIAMELQRAGFDIRAIRPPTVPEGTARLRISLNTSVSEHTLGILTEHLCRLCGKARIVAK